jgi:hypothetical protein
MPHSTHLVKDAVQVATTLHRVATDAASKHEVRVAVDKDLEVVQVSQLGGLQTQNAFASGVRCAFLSARNQLKHTQ